MSTATTTEALDLRPAPDAGGLDTALWALDAGFWPVALRRAGEAIEDASGARVATGKEPLRSRWGDVRPSPESLRSDFAADPERGVGMRLGPSGGWGDIEGDGPEWRDQFIALCGGEGLDTLGWDSKRGGHNMVLPPPPELAMIPSGFKAPWSEFGDLEIRLNGKDRQSQSVIPPTTTDGFPRSWRGPWRIAPLPEAAVSGLARLWQEDQRRNRAATTAGSRSTGARTKEGAGAVSTIDQWNAEQGRAGILAMLEAQGWRLVKEAADGVLYVRHPDATGPWSGSIGWCGDRLYCWSNSTAFPHEKPLDAFDVYRILEHGDDFRRALVALRERGYGPSEPRVKGFGAGRAAGAEPSGNGDGGGGGGKGGDPEPERPDAPPEILVTTLEHEVIGQAVGALRAEGELYQRGNVLVTVLRDAIKGKGFRRPPNTPRIGAVPGPRLREMLTRHARLVKSRKARSGDLETVPAHPPDWLVPAILARGDWPDIRHIEGIVEAPTIRPDGSVIDRPGWDEPTGLLYEPNATFGPVPSAPTLDDARAAARRLLRLIADFPFVSEEDRMAWLAALLTALARHAIDGPVPLFLFDANTPGTGKSLLCHLIALIIRGRMMACADYPENEEEMAKTLLAIALAGDPFVLFDNVATGFSVGGKSLDRALTATTVKGRILGRSEMSAELPWNSVVFASGNNLGIRGDALRRIIPARLETQEEQPEERTDYEIKDIARHAREHRPALVADALTILRAHAVAGRPDPGLSPIGSYEDWCRVIRNAVCWATGHDPAGPRKRARADDAETQAHEALVGGWARLMSCARSTEGMTAKEALDAIASGGDVHKDLRSLLCEWSKDGDLPSARVMGNRLNKIRGRMTAKGALDFSVYLGNRRWFVKPPKPAAPGGSSDSGDSCSSPRAENCKDNCNTKYPPHGGGKSHQSNQSHQNGFAVTDPDDANLGPAF